MPANTTETQLVQTLLFDRSRDFDNLSKHEQRPPRIFHRYSSKRTTDNLKLQLSPLFALGLQLTKQFDGGHA